MPSSPCACSDSVTGNTVMILSSGVYAISGKMTDGQIVVDSQNKGTVRLVLDGAEIQSSQTAAINVKNADKAVITLNQGTQNVLADAKRYTGVSAEEEPNAAIFSKDDLTIEGTGSLQVRANYNNGIMSKDDLRIAGGTIAIAAADDGLVGRDSIVAQREWGYHQACWRAAGWLRKAAVRRRGCPAVDSPDYIRNRLFRRSGRPFRQ